MASTCQICKRKFKNHQGLGGHLSGPCGGKRIAKKKPSVPKAPSVPASLAAPKLRQNGTGTRCFGKLTGTAVAVIDATPSAAGAKSFRVSGRSVEEVAKVIDEALSKAFGVIGTLERR